MAGLFRSSRLTLLLGEAGAGKTTLVKFGVLPIMDRRGRNVASSLMAYQRMEDSGATSPADRRGESANGPYSTVFFDRWDEAPLAGLRAAIDEASRQFSEHAVEPALTLADALIALSRERRVHFLIVLDRFEEFLAAPESSATREFTDQLVAALNTPFLPANFLISMRDDAEPLLEPLARRVPGFGDARLRVLPVRRAAEPVAPALPRAKRGESLISRAYGSPALDFDITSGAAEIAAPVGVVEHAVDHVSDRTPLVDRAPIAVASETPSGRLGDLLVPPLPDSGSAVPRAQPAPARRRWPWVASAIAAGALLLVVIANRPDRGAPEPSLGPKSTAPPPAGSPPAASNQAAPSASPSKAAAAQTPASAPFSQPPAAAEPTPAPTPGLAPAVVAGKSAFHFAVDAENNTATRMANDLAKAVGRDGLVVDVRATSEPAAGLAAGTHGEPRLMIVRRDAMEAASRSNDRAMTPEAARLLMPLFAEELYFIVRADSALRFIHQIENKRINIGASNGARALTARSAYQAMFGKAMPAAAGGALDVKHALDALTRDRAVDAIVVVAAEPAAFLTNMPRPMRQRIKLLSLDSGDPAERRALRSYLPATLREDANRVLPYQNIRTLAVMSFLLASPPTDPAGAERLKAFANSLCRNLPALRREGDPHWRQVRPGQALDTKWPDAGAAAASLRSCSKTSAAEPRRKRTMRKR